MYVNQYVTVVAPPSSVVKCLWGVFVWGFGVLFLSCVCVCRCRGSCSLSVCVCVCVCVCDLLIFYSGSVCTSGRHRASRCLRENEEHGRGRDPQGTDLQRTAPHRGAPLTTRERPTKGERPTQETHRRFLPASQPAAPRERVPPPDVSTAH